MAETTNAEEGSGDGDGDGDGDDSDNDGREDAMIRRLYSSACSSARASRSAEASTSSSAGSRGRVKPSWNLGARVSSRTKQAQGETPKRAKGKDVGVQASNGEKFQPIRLYPEQLSLHRAFTPPHLPLPVNMGTLQYKTASKSVVPAGAELFKRPPPPSPVEFLSTPPPAPSTSSSMSSSSLPPSAMTDHLTVISSLAHPSLTHHLGPFSPFSSEASLRAMALEPELHLSRVLAHASVSSRLSAEKSWESVLDHLSGSAASQAAVEAQTAGVDAAVDGLNALLGQIEIKAKGERRRARWAARVIAKREGRVQMDSVKRKRQKKISKHKYKKRRKVGFFVLY